MEALLNLVGGLLKLVFGWINLPDMPASVTSAIDELFAVLQGGFSIMGIFINMDVVKVLLPIVLIVVHFEEVWKFTMFVLKKIPFLGIE